jgi:hypothetical protein
MAVAAALQLLAAQRVRPRVGIPTLRVQPGLTALVAVLAVRVQAVLLAVVRLITARLRVAAVVARGWTKAA